MAGKNLLEIVLKLVDQASAPFRKAAKEVKAGSDEMAQGHDHAAKASDKAAESIGKTGKASEEAGRQHQEHNKHNHELEMGYMLLAAAATTAYATMVKGITASVQAHVREVAAFTGLRSVVIGTGKDYNQASEFVKSFTEDGLIAQAQAATALKNLLNRGFSLDQAIDMLTRLKDAAAFGRQAHLNMGDAVQSATEGIKNENSILVDNAGVTKNVSQMWKEYAAQLGKSVDKLTLAEKRQAEYNGIMNETRHQVGDAAKLANDLGGQMAKTGQATEKAAAALGAAWAPAVALGAKLLGGLMNLVREAAERFPGLTFAVTAVATAVVGMTAAWLGWMAIQGPVLAAMTAITAKAGVMWTAITGPVGLAVAGITAVAGALYYLATAELRAAEAAARNARAQEQAAQDAADAARNKVNEIVRQEADLQNQITDLEKQAAKQRSEIARREREERRQEANQFGDLLVSALRKQYEAQQQAEEEALTKQFDKLKDFYDKRLDTAKQAHDKELDQLKAALDAETDAIRDGADAQRDALRKAHDDAVDSWQQRRDDLREQQQAQVDNEREFYDTLRDFSKQHYEEERDRLKAWADEQERIIRSTYTAQLRLLDDETARQVDALEGQIDAIDRQTREEEKADRTRRRNQKIAELEAQAVTAESEAERLRLVQEAADLRAEAEREALLEARDAQKEALRQQIEAIRKNAEERREALRSAQEQELDNLRQNLEAKQKALDEAHKAELKQIDEREKAALASLERRHKAELDDLDQEKKALDDKLATDLKRVDDLEKEQIASAERVFKEKQAKLDDSLAAEEQFHKDTLALLEGLEKAEKQQLHEKYFGKDGLLQEHQLYAEALKLVYDNNQKEILELLNQYEPDWQNQGKDFVQRLAEGGEEAKPEVEALADAINILLQASTENVLALQDAAGDGAAELAEINNQLSSAKQALAELQGVRQQAESEAAAADRALQDAQLKSAEAQKTVEETKKSLLEQWADALGGAAGSVNGSPSMSQAEKDWITGMFKSGKPQGSKHGGGEVHTTGEYRLLQGERVLSRAEAHKWDQFRPMLRRMGVTSAAGPRLVDLSKATDVANGAEVISSAGSVYNMTLVMKDPVVREELDIRRLAQATSQAMLTKIRQKDR